MTKRTLISENLHPHNSKRANLCHWEELLLNKEWTGVTWILRLIVSWILHYNNWICFADHKVIKYYFDTENVVIFLVSKLDF